jgi:hypothetical protein
MQIVITEAEGTESGLYQSSASESSAARRLKRDPSKASGDNVVSQAERSVRNLRTSNRI